MMHGRRNIDKKLSAKIAKLYDSGAAPDDIAKRTGVSRTTVFNKASDAHIARKRGEYREYTPAIFRKMVRLYQQQKLSCGEVAKKLTVLVGWKVTKSTVTRTVKDAGVTRSKSHARRLYNEKMGRIKGNITMFTCKICDKNKPLSDLVENRMFRPTIYGCKYCIQGVSK